MKQLLTFVGKAVLCALALTVGTLIGAPISTALGAVLPAIPAGVDQGSLALSGAFASFVLALALGPLARGLAAGFLARWAMLGLLAYVCLGVNTAIEAALFTTVGGTSGLIVLNVFSSVLFAAAVAAAFRPSSELPGWRVSWRGFWRRHGTPQWAWRLAAAVLAFPVTYLLFGMMAGPFVVDAYRAGEFGLTLPGLDRILPVQFLRSGLFLVASLPVLVAWQGSRLRLSLALGTAHFGLVGLFGMLQASWLPGSMRLIHSVEILADSLCYAAVLVALLVPPREKDQPSISLTSVAA
jgi:hypothetical protein